MSINAATSYSLYAYNWGFVAPVVKTAREGSATDMPVDQQAIIADMQAMQLTRNTTTVLTTPTVAFWRPAASPDRKQGLKAYGVK